MSELSSVERERYQRQMLLLGDESQLRLKNASVLVVGAGGLGCPVLMYLAGAGIGKLGIIDNDIVEVSNLHRQVLFGTNDLNKYKAEAASERIKGMNPEIVTEVIIAKLNITNAISIIERYDLVIDCTDNFAARYLVNDACVIADKPFVYAGISGFQLQVSVFNYHSGPTYRCAFPQPPLPGTFKTCNMHGVTGSVTGIAGSIQATEAIKIITCTGKPLAGEILIIDTFSGKTNSVIIKRNSENWQGIPQDADEMSRMDYDEFCNNGINSISIDELQQMNRRHIQIVDVRTKEESGSPPFGDVINIPVSAITEQFHLLDKSKPLILFCASGSRSNEAAMILRKLGYEGIIYNLRGGLKSVTANAGI